MKLELRILLVITILIMSLTACGAATPPVQEMTEAPTQEPTIPAGENFKTLVAGTLTAIAQQALTETIEPSLTATVYLTPSNTVPPPPTPTEEVVNITMTGDTYCRKGPATYFSAVGILPAGSTAEVIGRDSIGEFLYVQTLEMSCWIWGENGTITGNLGILPVFTPQPTAVPSRTPTMPLIASFSASFSGLTVCPGGQAANFTISNIGRLKLESIKISNKVQGYDDPFVHISDVFQQWSGGSIYQKSIELLPNESAVVTTCQPGGFNFDPTGIKIKAVITVCSIDGLKGSCAKQELSYVP